MFCPNCGAQCDNSAAHCPNCGAVISQTADGAAYNSPSVAAPNYGYNPNPGYNAASAAPKRSSTAVLVLGIVAIVINLGLGCLCGCLGSIPGIVCGIVGLVLGFKNKKTYAPGETDKKNDNGVILCFVSFGILLVVTIINMVMGATVYADYF